jgi:hypothetical protein
MRPLALTGRTLLACALLAVPALTRAEQVVVPLHGFHEVPSVSSAARGRFVADIDRGGGSIRYELRYEALQGDVRQAHIHIGQRHTNGGISVFLCQTATNPDPTGLAPTCGAAPARVSGVLTAANVVGPTGQGVAAGEFAELVRAIRAGAAYVNVHSATFPGGEVRGQLGHGH